MHKAIVTYVFFLGLAQSICAMNPEQKPLIDFGTEVVDSKSDQTTAPAPHVAINLENINQTVQQSLHNEGDYSIWYLPKYRHSNRFINKSADDVDGILTDLITQQDAPVAQKDSLKNLRNAIKNCAKSEQLSGDFIYLVCAKDKALELRSVLDREKNLAGKVYTFDLAKQSFEQQSKEINKDLSIERNSKISLCMVGTLCVFITLLMILGSPR